MTSTYVQHAHIPWTEDDQRAVTTARVLAMDAVQEAGHGHPGTAVSLAPAAHLIFRRFLRHDPADPRWRGRDRFVLSCGHSSLTLYIQLYLAGYPLTLDDLRAYRKRGSLTPAHPEWGHTPGVETTTGPLGQGIATAVGMAMGARRERGLLDPDAPEGTSPFDHRVFVLCSDGDIQEGISAEAGSFAGHQRLGNLVVVYDDNRISIEGSTELATSEDVGARYEAYGWHVRRVGLAADGDIDVSDLSRALEEAAAETTRPSIILMRSIISWPVPGAQNTAKSHGSALGADAVRAAKSVLGVNPDTAFDVSADLHERLTSAARAVGSAARREWDAAFDAWARGNPDGRALLDRLTAKGLPAAFEDARPVFAADTRVATRKAFGRALNAAAAELPELWGGSSDLGESNNTTVEGSSSFLPASSAQPGADPAGRTVHWGIREHFMAAAMNGIALSGLSRPYGGTFLVFSDYMRPAVRLAALMKLPTLYVWTHDSIGLGEDGPTHQPVEHLASLRAIPGLDIVRPGDANETAVTLWKVLGAAGSAGPTGFSLSRQDLPVFPDGTDGFGSAAEAVRGGYVRYEAPVADPSAAPSDPDVVVIATGSEVELAVTAARALAADGIRARVVSMPCREWFDAQDAAYRDSVIPPAVRRRIAVEAGVGQGWYDLIGLDGRSIGVQEFGASASAAELYEHFGLTADAVASAARELMGG
ncbi:transketolase [Streptomyces sp. CBMA29]|uniref:transketolase n=1 Tax=Streptomyces sp. CBMA29 TaxID=1896314 RepID=UPI001662017A|nr:transketolase [Streptomyces sp. CBMA29]MBD0739088.1 transketolase [Streptomyces sp. CBMA29]